MPPDPFFKYKNVSAVGLLGHKVFEETRSHFGSSFSWGLLRCLHPVADLARSTIRARAVLRLLAPPQWLCNMLLALLMPVRTFVDAQHHYVSQRGVGQGNHLSSVWYLLASHILAVIIQTELSTLSWQGFFATSQYLNKELFGICWTSMCVAGSPAGLT